MHRHGKASATASSATASSNNNNSTPPMAFSIPLKHTSKPVAFPADFEKHIALEFGMRYLFEIGVTPTMENCRAVLKEMPLKSCSVTAAWRSRGCLNDAIVIQPNRAVGVSGGGDGVGDTGGTNNKIIGDVPPPAAAPPRAKPVQNINNNAATGGGNPLLSQQQQQQPSVDSAVDNDPTTTRARISTKRIPRAKRGATLTQHQLTSSTTTASPHKVSVFVDQVASGARPVIFDTRATAIGTGPSARPRNYCATTTNGSNENNNTGPLQLSSDTNSRRAVDSSSTTRTAAKRRTTGGRTISSSSSGGGGDRDDGGDGCYRRKYPVGRISSGEPRISGSGSKVTGSAVKIGAGGIVAGPWGGGGRGNDEEAALLAEARRMLLHPPQVDIAAIEAVQTAFARNFPFQQHGQKFSEASVRSSLKELIKSDGPTRLIGLLCHHLFWTMLLPFALACEARDAAFLFEEDIRPDREHMNKAITSATGKRPRTAKKPITHTTQELSAVPPTTEACRDNTATGNEAISPPGFISPEADKPRVELSTEEADVLFVAVVQAWSTIRSSLGTSRRARLVQLPVVVAAVRHGVQTVLCNCYPFLEKGGIEGKRLLASLHEEVAAKFIPRFYYEGPFTPVSEEEQHTKHQMIAAQLSGGGKTVPHAASAAPPPPPADVMGASPRYHHSLLPVAGEGKSPATTPIVGRKSGMGISQLVGRTTRRSTRLSPSSSRLRPADTSGLGEAFFTTSNTLRYVFPNPSSPQARIMAVSKARARSSRDASNTVTPAGNRLELTGTPLISTPSAAAATAQNARIPLLSRRAATAGAGGRHFVGGDEEGIFTNNNRRRRIVRTTPLTKRPQAIIGLGSSSVVGTRGLDGNNNNNSHDNDQDEQQRPMTTMTMAMPTTSPSSSTAQQQQQQRQQHALAVAATAAATRNNYYYCYNNDTSTFITAAGATDSTAVDSRPATCPGNTAIGAAARARMYRGYCEERGVEYDRQYRRDGGGHLLVRTSLLSR